ncbi:MAG: NAD(P)/FAD-dependent oxidoreductase [bacterium]|nr:NAD(P)/FAD-dependent oxidoreductase [bacterium]
MDHFDVVIVGAGLSGIDAACHLQEKCPERTFTLLEGRDAIGGTWDLFRYPGIRSDSDMHTLGFSFKPWVAEKSIADGPAIREYVNEAADEFDVRQHIRFRHSLQAAAWSTAEKKWTLDVLVGGDETVQLSCNFLFMCAGYYDYERGYRPDFEGQDTFAGQIVDPQFWPEDLDYTDKRVAVIGSGATAMTIVPNMADDAAHVTMVQRSPTYVVSRPDRDAIANWLRKFLPNKWAYAITRFKNVQLQRFLYNRTRTKPERVKERLLGMVREELGPDYDVEKHFTPDYNPWDQRLCLIPNGDLYEGIREGRVSVVTDHISRFTENGIEMESGEKVEADIIVTATGLELKVLGGVEFSKDGAPISFPDTFSYKGMMYSDVPNLIQTFGYINASWTLRADITSEYACRVLNHMAATGKSIAVPRLRPEDEGMPALDWIDDFNPGYMKRMMHLFPKQSDRGPWRNTQNYTLDKKMIRNAPLEDGAIQFEG